jgi:hypothetical protein
LALLLIATLVFLPRQASAQAPQKMSYQAVIRDVGNKLVTNQSIGMRVSILQGSASGTAVYTETQKPTTNANGLVTVEIGTGLVITGTFATINWATGPYFIKTEIDPTSGTNYTVTGTSQLLSVPYALYAKTAENGFSGNYTDLSNKPTLFDGKYSSLTASPTLALVATSGSYNNLLDRPILLDSNYVVKTRGDQTIAGIKTFNNDLLVNGVFVGKGKGSILTNTAIGTGTLNTNTTGYYNTATGYNALFSNTSGDSNTANGKSALYSNTTGKYNTANGSSALYFNTAGFNNTANGSLSLYSNSTGSGNTATGMFTLYSNTTGYYNTANGTSSLFSNSTGYSNTAIGNMTMLLNATGNYNTANGFEALYSNTSGSSNIAIGAYSGYNNTTSSQNIFIGDSAGYNCKAGLNQFIGHYAGLYNTTGSNNTANGNYALYLNTTGNNNTAIGLGTLSNNTTGSNNIGIGLNAQVPSATGSNQIRIGNTNITYAGIQVAWTITSDRRLKSEITKSDLGLNFIKKLKPVSYVRINDQTQKKEYGFIAQEVEETLNGLGVTKTGMVAKDDAGMYSVRYNDLFAPMVKALQEQQETINTLEEKNKQLENRLKAIEEKLKL